jgi:hypothetical protein
MRNVSAQLALPQSTITRDIRKGNSTERTTIDLIFITKTLQNTILNYRIIRELKQSFDHLLISTEFEWENVRETQKKRQRRV